MEAHQERVIKEQGDLDFKIGKLSSFITGDVYPTLNEAEQYRLSRQLGIMQQYSEVLGERIGAF